MKLWELELLQFSYIQLDDTLLTFSSSACPSNFASQFGDIKFAIILKIKRPNFSLSKNIPSYKNHSCVKSGFSLIT